MSVTESPLQLAVLAVVAACLVTAGAFLAFGGDEQTAAPEPVGQNASERYSSVDSVSANVTTVFRGPNETTRTEMVVKMRPGTGYFYQRVIDHETLGTREIYANGSVLSIYDPEENEVTRLNGYSEQTVSGNMSERLGKLFSEINEQRGASDGDGSEESVSPLPSLPADTTTSGPADNASAANVAEYDVTYLGTDTVDGRDAHVVRIDGEFRDRGLKFRTSRRRCGSIRSGTSPSGTIRSGRATGRRTNSNRRTRTWSSTPDSTIRRSSSALNSTFEYVDSSSYVSPLLSHS
jgi:outer membrane lipoprotein-sorting protein